jgi:hypothetical protein
MGGCQALPCLRPLGSMEPWLASTRKAARRPMLTAGPTGRAEDSHRHFDVLDTAPARTAQDTPTEGSELIQVRNLGHDRSGVNLLGTGRRPEEYVSHDPSAAGPTR